MEVNQLPRCFLFIGHLKTEMVVRNALGQAGGWVGGARAKSRKKAAAVSLAVWDQVQGIEEPS